MYVRDGHARDLWVEPIPAKQVIPARRAIPAKQGDARSQEFGRSSIGLVLVAILVLTSGCSKSRRRGAEFGIQISAPSDGEVTNAVELVVRGTAPRANEVRVNGVSATLNGDAFEVTVPVFEGTNTLTAIATGPSEAVAAVTVRRDTSPPTIVIETPREGERIIPSSPPPTDGQLDPGGSFGSPTDPPPPPPPSAQVSVAGTVNDVIPGATINADDVTVTVNGVAAAVSNRTFFVPSVPLVPGRNDLLIEAVDKAGNVRQVVRAVTFDPDVEQLRLVLVGGNGQRGAVRTTLPSPLTVLALDQQGQPIAGRPLRFRVARGDGRIGASADRREVLMLTGADGRASIPFTLGTRSGEGFHRVLVESPGTVTSAEFCATARAGQPATTSAVEFPPGRAPVDEELRLPLSVIVCDASGNCRAGVPVSFRVTEGGGLVDGQAELVAPTDPDGIARASFRLGPDAGLNEVQVNFVGSLGLPVRFRIEGLVPGAIADTSVSGTVVDNAGNPIDGVPVEIEPNGPMATTGQDGRFFIPEITPGATRVAVLGSRTPGNPDLPDIEFLVEAVAGADNPLHQVVTLPAVNPKVMVGGAQDVDLSIPGVPGFRIRVFANSTTRPDGTRGPLLMSSSQVKFDRVPMPPPQGSNPIIVGTLQPGGTHFDPPAQVIYPNSQGLAPGDVADVFAFHHDIGQFVNVGPATVSDDGSVARTDPGFGLLQSGWHCLIRIPGPTGECRNSCTGSLSWTITQNGSGSGTGVITLCGAVMPDDRMQASVTANFSPAGGSFDAGSSWTSSDPDVVAIVGAASGTGTVTIEGVAGGTATLTSPVYRIPGTGGQPDETCQVSVEARVMRVLIKDRMGAVLTGPVTTERVAVMTRLSAEVEPTTPVTGFEWTVGGNALRTYEHDIDNAALHRPIMLTAADRTADTLDFVWRDEGTHEVAVEVEVNGVTCRSSLDFMVTHESDPNRLVYCNRAAMDYDRRNPDGTASTYRALENHGRWHMGATMVSDRDPGGTPTSSGSSWGNSGMMGTSYNGTAFLLWHRNYIDAHIAWRGTFGVSTPSLATPAPGGRPRPPYLQEAPTTTQADPVYGYVRLGEFGNIDELGDVVVHPWHNLGHVDIAAGSGFGDMGFENTAPAAPESVFWRWHTTVDSVRTDFEGLDGPNRASVILLDPAPGAEVAAGYEFITVVFDLPVSFRAPAHNRVQIAADALHIDGIEVLGMDEAPGFEGRQQAFRFRVAPLSAGEYSLSLEGTRSFEDRRWRFSVR